MSECNPSIVDIQSTRDLPYRYEPFDSVIRARAKHPCGTFYVYTGKAPKGFAIVAYLIEMYPPKPKEEVVEATNG